MSIYKFNADTIRLFFRLYMLRLMSNRYKIPNHKKRNIIVTQPTSTFSRIYYKMRSYAYAYDLCNLIFSFTGIILSLFVAEMTWEYKCLTKPETIIGCNKIDNWETQSLELFQSMNILKWVIFCFHIFLSFSLVLTYYNNYLWKKQQNEIFSQETFLSSGLLKYLILEIMVAFIQPIPNVSLDITIEQLGFTICYPIDVCLTMAMLVKLYYIIRFAAHNNGMYNSLSKWISRSVAIEITPLFIFKNQIANSPIKVTSIILISSAFISSYCIRNCERPVNEDFIYIWNSLWLSFVTMTTVGYGDIYPITHCGRFFSMISCFIAMIVRGVWVYAVSTKLNFSANEKRFINMTREARRKNNLETLAALMVQAWWKNHKARFTFNSRINPQRQKFLASQKSMKTLRAWRNARRIAQIEDQDYRQYHNEIIHQNELILKNLKKLEKKNNNI